MVSEQLTTHGIAALRAGDRASARASLVAALQVNPGDARAWLWLSGALDAPAEQRYCLERALVLDPASAAARQGLAMLSGVVARRPAMLPCEAETPPVSQPTVRPWRAIWWRPWAALRAAAAAPAPLSAALRAALSGVSALFAWAAWRGLGAEARPGEVLVIVLLAGVPLGLAALIIGGVLLRTSGQWLGGRAGARQVRAVLALAFAPVAGGLPLWLLQLALLPAASFGGLPLAAQGPLLWLCWGAHGLLWLWAAGLSVVGLAAAHGISPWRAAASWLLAGLIVAGGIGVLFGGSALVIGLRGG